MDQEGELHSTGVMASNHSSTGPAVPVRHVRRACPAGTASLPLEVPCAAFLWHLCGVGDVGNLGLDFLDHIAVPAQLLKFVGEFGKFGAAGHLGRELVQGDVLLVVVTD